jgi:hypothetical protein
MHAYTVRILYVYPIGDGLYSLGTGITNVNVMPPQKSTGDDFFVLANETWVTIVLTYDDSTVTCIKLTSNILHKTATYGTDIYQTLWTIRPQSTGIGSSNSNGSIRLLAVSACTFRSESWCVATVKHGSNDIEIMQVDSDKTTKQLAYIKGPAITELTDVIGAIALQCNNMRLQLVVAHRYDSMLRVYDTIDGQEVGKPISIRVGGDTIADMFIDTHSNSVFTTSTWLPSVHSWSLKTDTSNNGYSMIDAAHDDITHSRRLHEKRWNSCRYTKLLANIQQHPPTLLENLNLITWCTQEGHLHLLERLLLPTLSPIAEGKLT